MYYFIPHVWNVLCAISELKNVSSTLLFACILTQPLPTGLMRTAPSYRQTPKIQVSDKQRNKCIHKIHCFHGPVSSKSVTATMMPPLNIWPWPQFMVHLSLNCFPTSVPISPHLPLHLDNADIIRYLNHKQYRPLLHDTVPQKQGQSIIKAWSHLQQ
jgi:hypothetical protein